MPFQFKIETKLSKYVKSDNVEMKSIRLSTTLEAAHTSVEHSIVSSTMKRSAMHCQSKYRQNSQQNHPARRRDVDEQNAETKITEVTTRKAGIACVVRLHLTSACALEKKHPIISHAQRAQAAERKMSPKMPAAVTAAPAPGPCTTKGRGV